MLLIITIDGLDNSGKSTIGALVSEITGLSYTKVKKGSFLDFSRCSSEYKITNRIIQEIDLSVNDLSDIVLDRSYLSAAITGKIYDPNLDLKELLSTVPERLKKPTLGLVVTVSHHVALSRKRKSLTYQDMIILGSDYDHYQDMLRTLGQENGCIIYDNSSPRSIKELKYSLENLLVRHGF